MKFRHVLLAAVVPMTACGDSSSDDNADAQTIPDPPAECELGAPPDGWTYPAGPYGADVGDKFEDITLRNCQNEDVQFSDILAQSKLVLFSIGAGWCEPCIEESKTLDAEIFRRFCPRDFQVVQVLFQDAGSQRPTTKFCSEWSARFGLSFTVLIDPVFDNDTTRKYFTDVAAQTPINFLINQEGEIVFKEVGTPANDLPLRVEEFLP